jgi:cbb3-type cytochrome oxidase subunit 3
MGEFTAIFWLVLTIIVVVVIAFAYKRRPGPPSDDIRGD